MAITNSVNFRLWVNEKAKIRGQVLSDIYGLLNVRADADEVVKIALAESWTGKEMVEYLGSGSGAASVSVQKPGAAIPMPPPATAIPVPPPVPTASPAPRTGGKPTRADALRMKRGGPAQVIEAVPSEQPAVKKGDRSHPKVDDQEPKPAKEGFFKSWPKKGDPAKVHTEPAEKPAGAKKKGLIIAIIVIVVVLLVGGGIAYFSISGGGGGDYTPRNTPASDQPTQSPTQPGVVPTQQPSAEQSRWQEFLSLNAKSSEERGAFLDKPVMNDPNSPNYLFKHFPTRWLLWIIPIVMLWTLLKQDRLAAEEVTDVKAAKRGLIALFVGVLGGKLIATVITAGLAAVGNAYVVESWPFVLMGIVINLWSNWQASTAGRIDYTALAVAGLFITGVVIIWWFTPSTYLVILGSILMAAGIFLEAKEMSRTHQGLRGLLTALIMILILGGITWLIYFLLGLVPPASASMPLIQQFFFTALFTGRVFVGALIGLGIAYVGGDFISTAIMPPETANGTAFVGKQEPSNHEGRSSGPQDDFTNRWKVNSRYDAMSFALMVLYPLVTAIWFIAMIF